MAVSAGSSFDKVVVKRGKEDNGEMTWYKFNLTTKNPYLSGSKLLITLPEEVGLRTIDGTFVECSGEGDLKVSLECKLTGLKRISIALDLQVKTEIAAGATVTFTLFNLINPLSFKPSSLFNFELRTNNRLYLISKEDTLSITNDVVTPIVSAEIIAANPTLGKESAYSVIFTPVLALMKNAIVKITMPKKLRKASTVNSFNCTS